ncbi:MAG: tRNA uridine-5-carboxymethylaminomethyl(34) synthesis GTPase MnmE [Rhodospirillales bacterium]|nr:tRNA uridine-5-carboxymethylaminomethyl(34) synthesis GTPase MnmE [Rhodospirillales bacterium]
MAGACPRRCCRVKFAERDTIFALASGAAMAAVAVLRISGADSGRILAALAGAVPPPRRASLRRLRDARGETLDRALVLWLPGPGSFTGEDGAELHLHGGRAVLDGVSAALVALGARPAEPGEFSRRAFLNGRIDLTEAEGVADLVAAETAAQRRQALAQMEGGLAARLTGWADRLRLLLAACEARIDFPEEAMPEEAEDAAHAEMRVLGAEMQAALAEGARAERLRDGLVFTVAGAPNVGKSSLVNALAGAEIAIVSAMPGTTRDVLETRLDLGGIPVALIDTAGLRETDDPIEAEGVRRARARAASADLVLAVGCPGIAAPAHPDALVIANKIDLGGTVPAGALGVSARTGQGMAELRAALAEAARRLTAAGNPAPLTRARHRAALAEATARLEAAASTDLAELAAEDLRLALRALGRITGMVGVEDLLDTIFRAFCIGK